MLELTARSFETSYSFKNVSALVSAFAFAWKKTTVKTVIANVGNASHSSRVKITY